MLRIYGASDDLVEIEGHFEEEIDCYDSAVVITVGWPEASPGENARGLRVYIRYAPDWAKTGVWPVAVAPLDDDAEIPWPVSVTLGGRGYSSELTIDCPDDVPVSWKKIR